MDFALQRCCITPTYLKQYDASTDAVLKSLDIGLVEIKEFNCCGYPLKNIDFKAHILASARNLSLARERDLNIMTLCNCCYGTLKHVNHLLNEDASIREEINATLKKEGLEYQGGIEVKHLLEIFFKDIGIEQIREKIVKSFKGLNIAIHYGCHILRPRQLV